MVGLEEALAESSSSIRIGKRWTRTPVACQTAFATAPALIFVGCLMMAAAKDIEFDDPTEYLPAAVTIISMPLTFSIADGIAFGFIAYAGIKVLAGRWAELRIAVVVLAVLFVLRFALL